MALGIPLPSADFGGQLVGNSQNLFNQLMAQRSALIHPSGDVANAMFVEQMRNQFGEDDPRYIEAKKAHQMQLDARESLMGYRQQLAQTAPFRATSPLGKSIAEGQGRGALDMLMGDGGQHAPVGVQPEVGAVTGTPPLGSPKSPVDPQIQQAYEQEIAKKTTDADARKRLLFANNIDKTLETINLDDLTSYSGIQNIPKYLDHSGQAALGDAPEEFVRHKQAVESAAFLADQMRQFYGDSIQPAAMKRLRALANPSTWYQNPKVAKAQFEQLKKILEMETQTYKDAGTSPIKLRKPEIKLEDGKFKLDKSETKGAPKRLVYNPETGRLE